MPNPTSARASSLIPLNPPPPPSLLPQIPCPHSSSVTSTICLPDACFKEDPLDGLSAVQLHPTKLIGDVPEEEVKDGEEEDAEQDHGEVCYGHASLCGRLEEEIGHRKDQDQRGWDLED